MFLSVVISLFGFYGIIALLVKIFPKVVLEGLFLHRVCPPKRFLKLDQPSKVYGLVGAKCITLESASRNTIGVWHIPPLTQVDQSLDDAEQLVVYCHGNAFHRGFSHRVQLYNNLRKAGFHVVTFDYSGFADSTGRPSVKAAVNDAVSVLKWAIDQVSKDCTVILWGHSLGTHMSTRALLQYSESERRQPDCLILEAPFTSAVEASEHFPISRAFYFLYPYLKSEIQATIRGCNSECSTIDILPSVSIPIMIMHAEDDQRVDFNLGTKLYDTTISNPVTKSRFIRFIHINGCYGVQHYTARHPETQRIFREFVDDVKRFKGQGQESSPKYEILKI